MVGWIGWGGVGRKTILCNAVLCVEVSKKSVCMRCLASTHVKRVFTCGAHYRRMSKLCLPELSTSNRHRHQLPRRHCRRFPFSLHLKLRTDLNNRHI